MEKIIVEIKCPAVSKSFEFRLSKKLPVADGIKKIIEEIRGAEHNNEMLSSDDISLFNSNDRILNRDMTFAENGVKGGDILMIL